MNEDRGLQFIFDRSYCAQENQRGPAEQRKALAFHVNVELQVA